jgi:hypothetical protein
VDAEQLSLLDEVASHMRAAPADVYFIVEGHSDVSGPLAQRSRRTCR